MQDEKKSNQYYYISIGFGIWFLLTGWMWTYLLNLFIAYPIGIMGFFLWNKARKENPESPLNKIALGILIAGLVCSIAAIFFYK